MPGITFKAVNVFNLISKKKAQATSIALVKAATQIQFQQLQARINQNTGFTIYGYSNQTEQINAYASIDDLYSIVNKIMKTAAMIPIYEYVVTNDKAYRQLKIIQRKAIKSPNNKIIAEVKSLQNKALELAGEGSPLQYRLDHPNDFQSKGQFYELTYLFKLLTGNYYIYKNILDAGANDGQVYEIYNMPPNFTFPIASNDLPRRTAGYNFTLYNQAQQFSPDEIIHGKYANPVFDFSGNELIGLSPLQAGARTVQTIANEIDYINQALKNAGAGGVVVNEDPADLTAEALGQMKDDVLRELGSAFDGKSNINANKLAFLAGKWNYLKIFIDPANMQLLEQSKRSFKKLCNDYGVSDKLFNNDDGAKYDNYEIAIKELYTNAALPLVCGLCDDFNMGLVQHYGGTSVVGFDISDIPELGENKKDIADLFNALPAYRVNDLYESLGYGRLDDPNADVVLVKSGYQPLDEVAQPASIDLTQLNNNNLNDYQPNG